MTARAPCGANKVVYDRIGDKETLQVIGVVDASYKSDEKLMGGMLVMIAI